MKNDSMLSRTGKTASNTIPTGEAALIWASLAGFLDEEARSVKASPARQNRLHDIANRLRQCAAELKGGKSACATKEML